MKSEKLKEKPHFSEKAKSLNMSSNTYNSMLRAGQNPAKHLGAVNFKPSPRKSKK